MKTRSLFIIFLFLLPLSTQSVFAGEEAAKKEKSCLDLTNVKLEADAKIEGIKFIPQTSTTIGQSIDCGFGVATKVLKSVFFFDVSFGMFGKKSNGKLVEVPFIIIWLIIGALFFTVRFGFINFRVFRHSIRVVMGKYSKKDDVGEVSHFQALSTALSATVGLGNIAGVAIAIGIGGPGATFWMIMAGLFGMTTKFAEATSAQMYRVVRPDGHVMGGAMEYLSRGFKESGMAGFGKVLAIMFCIFCIGASISGGNAFQVSQSMAVVQGTVQDIFPAVTDKEFYDYRWIYGVILAVLVGAVIIGGLKRIAQTAAKIVPSMVFIYLLACLWIILSNFSLIGGAFGLIFSSAFTPAAGLGGIVGVLIVGFQRAAFSNEAGIGSAAIAHSAAKSAYPVREGFVALLEPFIDTVVICTMTALVIVITNHYATAPGVSTEVISLINADKGAAVTALAFGSQISWFPYILTICVMLFAFSTMISWSYYGERCWSYMFGEKSSIVFKLFFLVFTVLGSIASSSNILGFTDVLFFAMALPNLIGLYFLSGKISIALKEYMAKLKSGELDREVGRE